MIVVPKTALEEAVDAERGRSGAALGGSVEELLESVERVRQIGVYSNEVVNQGHETHLLKYGNGGRSRW